MKIDVKNMVGLAKDSAVAGKEDLTLQRFDKGAFDRAEIKKVSEDFESLFLNIVLKSMRDSVQKSGLIDGGNAEDIYTGMLDDEYAKMMASQRATGLADNIEQFLLRSYGDQAPAEGPKVAGLKAYQAQGLQTDAKRARMEIDDGAVSPPAQPAAESLTTQQLKTAR